MAGRKGSVAGGSRSLAAADIARLQAERAGRYAPPAEDDGDDLLDGGEGSAPGDK